MITLWNFARSPASGRWIAAEMKRVYVVESSSRSARSFPAKINDMCPLAVFADGIVCAGDGYLSYYAWDGSVKWTRRRARVSAMTSAADARGVYITKASGTTELWSLADGEILTELPGELLWDSPEVQLWGGNEPYVAWGDDSRIAVSGSPISWSVADAFIVMSFAFGRIRLFANGQELWSTPPTRGHALRVWIVDGLVVSFEEDPNDWRKETVVVRRDLVTGAVISRLVLTDTWGGAAISSSQVLTSRGHILDAVTGESIWSISPN